MLLVAAEDVWFAEDEAADETGAAAGLAASVDAGEEDAVDALVLGVEFARLSKPERCRTTSPPPAIAKHTTRAAIATSRFGDFRASCGSLLMI
jgi:hypothetical protein